MRFAPLRGQLPPADAAAGGNPALVYAACQHERRHRAGMNPSPETARLLARLIGRA